MISDTANNHVRTRKSADAVARVALQPGLQRDARCIDRMGSLDRSPGPAS